jgi:hypothetical protein
MKSRQPSAVSSQPEKNEASANGENKGRDARGRFAPGNLGGPGNPFARRTAQLRKTFAEAVSDEDLKELAAMLLFKAKSGDVAATKLVLAYTIGRPTEAVDPDGLDRAEAQRWEDDMMPLEEVHNVLYTGMPAEVLAMLARYMVPCRAETLRQHTAAVLRAGEAKDKAAAAKAAAVSRKKPLDPPAEEKESRRAETEAGGRRSGEAAPAPIGNGTNGEAQQRATREAKRRPGAQARERLGARVRRRARAGLSGGPNRRGSKDVRRRAPISNGTNGRYTPMGNGA